MLRWLGRLELNHIAGTQLVQVVGPGLHHDLPLFEKLCAVVSPAECIGNRVRKLRFDHFRWEIQALSQHGSCAGTESVGTVLCTGET